MVSKLVRKFLSKFLSKYKLLSKLISKLVIKLVSKLGKVSKIKCVLFVENSTKGGEGVRPFYKS